LNNSTEDDAISEEQIATWVALTGRMMRHHGVLPVVAFVLEHGPRMRRLHFNIPLERKDDTESV
jgi:hypothetical protein